VLGMGASIGGPVRVAETVLHRWAGRPGRPSATAMSTAIAFRMVTYYLPPVWGAIAMRWLRQHSYL
jgi:uncharacterized membrane protein YbhN (UPF0104 family)